MSGVGLQVKPCLAQGGQCQGQSALGGDEITLGFIQAHQRSLSGGILPLHQVAVSFHESEIAPLQAQLLLGRQELGHRIPDLGANGDFQILHAFFQFHCSQPGLFDSGPVSPAGKEVEGETQSHGCTIIIFFQTQIVNVGPLITGPQIQVGIESGAGDLYLGLSLLDTNLALEDIGPVGMGVPDTALKK